MIHGQFLPKSSSNWRFVIQDSRVRGLCVNEVEGLQRTAVVGVSVTNFLDQHYFALKCALRYAELDGTVFVCLQVTFSSKIYK